MNIAPLSFYPLCTSNAGGVSCRAVKATPNGIILRIGNSNTKYDITGIDIDVAGCGKSSEPSTLPPYAPSTLVPKNEGRYVINCTLTGTEYSAPLYINYIRSDISKTFHELGWINTEIEDK